MTKRYRATVREVKDDVIPGYYSHEIFMKEEKEGRWVQYDDMVKRLESQKKRLLKKHGIEE